jgi:hypothetical protein
MNVMTEPTKRRTSRPVLTKLHSLLLKACPPGPDNCEGSIRGTLAGALGVSYQYVYRWIEMDRVPPKFVKPLLEIAEGRVTQEELIVFVI